MNPPAHPNLSQSHLHLVQRYLDQMHLAQPLFCSDRAVQGYLGSNQEISSSGRQTRKKERDIYNIYIYIYQRCCGNDYIQSEVENSTSIDQ